MCGRMNVSDHPGIRRLMDDLGIPVYPTQNLDLRPSQRVFCFSHESDVYQAHEYQWGIKPTWAKTLLINAKAETVTQKATFKHAFSASRVLIPFTGWYEWRDEGGNKKQKYLFTHSCDEPMLMGAIAYPEHAQIVTLTTAANDQCKPIHHRMPVIVDKSQIENWFQLSAPDVLPNNFTNLNITLNIEKSE